MAIIGGVTVTGFIAPSTSGDTYAVIDPLYGIDGLRSVVNSVERNAITPLRRRMGMITYQQDIDTYYKLLSPPWSYTDSDWAIITFGGSNSSSYSNILVSATTANNYSGTSIPVITGYNASYVYITTFAETNTNTGTTINIEGLGDLNITKIGDNGLVPVDAYDILSDVTYYLIYNGDSMQLLAPNNVFNYNVGNRWHVPYGVTVTVPDDFQTFIYGDLYVEGTIDVQTNGQLVVLNGNIIMSGGSIVGSGTTYVVQLPDFDTKVTALSLSGSVLTLTQNDSSSYSVTIPNTGGGGGPFTGNTSASCISNLYITNLWSCADDTIYIQQNGGNVSIGTTASTAVLTVMGSGTTRPIFRVQGSQGELFAVNDSLIGSLFSVNDISGLPILEVFSNDTILMGSYVAPSLNTTTRVTATSGSSTNVYSIPISAYTGAFFEYTVNSGANYRAGSVMSIWNNGTTVNYTETSTADIGVTSDLILSVTNDGLNANLIASATTNNWIVKTIIRSI